MIPSLAFTGDSYDVCPLAGLPSAARVPDPRPSESRSPKWRAVERKAVEGHPWCSACGATSDLQGHHIVPYHVDPSKELDDGNVMVACRRCHLFVCHLGSWTSWNEHAVRDAAEWLAKIRTRPYAEAAA